MNLGDLNKVWEIKALKRKPNEQQATKILEKIAQQVQPIMHKRKWRVKLLSEFSPTNPSLLGLNVGAGLNIKLRLRKPNMDFELFPFHQVLDTMLHELCHNVHAPHNGSFYKLWDELRNECEEFMAKGITSSGEGFEFDFQGRRLGGYGGYSNQPPSSSLHKTALAAAEKRSLLSSRPKRVGGDSVVMKALSPAQAAVMAAERRLQDDIWCASQSCQLEHGNYESSENLENKQNTVGSSRLTDNSSLPLDSVSRKRSRRDEDSSLPVHASSTSAFVDSTMDTQQRRFGVESNSHFQFNYNAGSCSANLSGSSMLLSGDNRMLHCEEPAMWECPMCTLLNKSLAPICELCGTQQPKGATSEHITCSCKFCTLDNSVKVEKCSVCDQWRYSHTAPV